VTGVDSSKTGIAAARNLLPSAKFYEMRVYDDTERLPDRDFDAVVSTEVVEHLYSLQALPCFASSILRPSGLLIIFTPYHGFLKNLAVSLFNGWDAHHTPLWEGGHIKFWSRKTLTHLLEKNGFVVISFHGAGRLPLLWKSMILVARKV